MTFFLPEAPNYGRVPGLSLCNSYGSTPCPPTRQVYNLKVDASGRIVLPAPTRERLHIAGGDTVAIVEDETGVHLKTLDQVIAEAQAYFASFVPRGVCLGDEINAERRAELERDS